MATEVERLATIPIFGQYAPEAIDTILETIISEMQSKAPSLWALLFHLCQTTEKTPDNKQTRSNHIHCIEYLLRKAPASLSWPFYYSPHVQRDTFTLLPITLAGQNRTSPPFGP
jgi:hypothetical protein